MGSLHVIAGVVQKSGQILIARRRQDDSLPGKWEFPGGGLEEGENHTECLMRELREELEIEVRVGKRIGTSYHRHERGEIVLHTYHVEWVSGDITLHEHDAFEWVTAEQLGLFDLAPGDILVGRALRGEPVPEYEA